MKIATAVILLMILTLVACTGILSNSSQIPASNTVTPDKTQTRIQQGVVIRLKQSGGIAGVEKEWTISADGKTSGSTETAAQISQEAVAALLQRIDQLGFYNLESTYMPDNTCCDRFTYELTVSDQGKSNRVTFLEGASEVPASLLQILDIVQKPIIEAGK